MVNWAAPSAVNPGLLDDTLLMTPAWGLPWSISSHAFLATATATVGSWYVMPALLSAAKKLASRHELPGSACAGVATPSTAAKPARMTRNRTASSSYRLAPMSRPISTRMTVLRTDWTDQVRVLHDGRVDIGYVRMPIDLTALSSWLLFTEPQVAVVPVAHQLAGRDRVSVHELVGERLLQHPNAVPEWAALHSTPLVVARQARSVEEKLEWVAAGEGFSVVPQSVAMYYQRPDITWMVLTDVAPNEVRLAWPTAQHGRLIEDYLEAARSTVEK